MDDEQIGNTKLPGTAKSSRPLHVPVLVGETAVQALTVTVTTLLDAVLLPALYCALSRQVPAGVSVTLAEKACLLESFAVVSFFHVVPT